MSMCFGDIAPPLPCPDENLIQEAYSQRLTTHLTSCESTISHAVDQISNNILIFHLMAPSLFIHSGSITHMPLFLTVKYNHLIGGSFTGGQLGWAAHSMGSI